MFYAALSVTLYSLPSLFSPAKSFNFILIAMFAYGGTKKRWSSEICITNNECEQFVAAPAYFSPASKENVSLVAKSSGRLSPCKQKREQTSHASTQRTIFVT